jgi:hypothetical protein
LPRQLDDYTRLAHPKAHQRRTTEDHADVASEPVRMNNGDDGVAEVRRMDDLDLASLHHEEGHVPLATFDQHFAACDWTNHTMAGDPAICSAVNVGNMSDAVAALVSGVERDVSVNMAQAP